MSFPNPPVPDQEYTHTNGITYIYSSSKGAWEIKYQSATNTASLPLVNPTSRYLPTAGASLPDSSGLLTQSHYNEWAFNSLVKVDETSRVDSGENAPADADTNQLWYKPSTGSLYVYYNDGNSTQWVEIGGSGGLDDAPIDGTLYGRQDGAWTEVTGAGGEESQPFIKWHQFAVIERSTRFDYDPIWEVNANSSNNGWEYQIDLLNNGNWQEVSGLGEPYLTQIGWYGSMSSSHLRLNKVDSQTNMYPSAKVRFYVTTELNGVTNTDYSCELPAWTSGECDYSSAVAELSKRVTQGETIQSEVLSSIQQIQVQAGLHQLNLDNINADQITQNDDISSLQNQVDALEIQKGIVASYDCAATAMPYNPRTGECMFSDAAAASVVVLGFGIEDKNGGLTKPILNGDIIEIVKDGVISRYSVLDAASAPQMVAVDFVSGDQTFATNQEYNVYIYPQNASGVSKEYVDDQDDLVRTYVDDSINAISTPDLDAYVSKSGNQTLNKDATWRLRQDDSTNTSKTFLSINDGVMNLYHVADPGADTHAANRKYVKEQDDLVKGYVDTEIGNIVIPDVSGYLPLTGGTLTGDLAMDGNKITGLGTPTANAQAANKGYVDQQISQIASPEVIVPGNSPSRPPGLRFGYVSGSSVTNGKFAWYDSGGRRLRISATSKDFPWGTDSPTGDISYSESHLFHIYATTTSNGQDKWRIKVTGSFDRMDWHTNDILLYVPYHIANGSFSETADYYITISGLF